MFASLHFAEVLIGKESAVYADSTYASKKNEKWLRSGDNAKLSTKNKT